MLTFNTEYNYSIPHRLIPKCAKIGIVDQSDKPQIVAATVTNKVIIHEKETVLNINEKIEVLEIHQFEGDQYATICIGTASGIMAYDANWNRKIFQKDISDGVHCVKIGKFSSFDTLIICGASCAIWGLDKSGAEQYWTVTGDNVLALCLCDVDEDGINEIVSGSEDHDIRVFKDDLLLYEINEMDNVIALQDLGEGRFAYALINGTVGVYKRQVRLWRIKSKQQVIALCSLPNQQSLACAWIHGKLDVREWRTGEVLLKESVNGPLADALVFSNQFVLVTVDGKVNGYTINQQEKTIDQQQTIIHDLGVKKHNLLMELQNYEHQNRMKTDDTGGKVEKSIPANTTLETTLAISDDKKKNALEMKVKVSSDAVIRGVILFAEGIFSGESYIVHPVNDYTSSLTIYLQPIRDVAVPVHIKVFVGYPRSIQLHVFEASRAIPRFAMYAYCPEVLDDPEGKLTFMINEKLQAFTAWLCENFFVRIENLSNDAVLIARFIGLRNREVLVIEVDENGKVTIRSNNMRLVGDIVQSLAEFFQIREIVSTANFPTEIAALKSLTDKLNEMYITRDRLATETAERVNSIREILVRTEDAYMLGKLGLMRKYYLKLHSMNQAMMVEHQIRCNNHEQLLAAFRDLNKIIEKGARLRVGEPASRVVAACRNAIVNENFDMLPKVILFGI